MTDKEMWEQDIEFMAKLREENEELKKKIEKAIEYINQYSYRVDDRDYAYELECIDKIDNLLEILKD